MARTKTAARRVYVQRREGWGVTAEGEVWRLGRFGYMAGYCSAPRDPDAFANAVDAAEEEARVLVAEAALEFGR